MAGVELLLRHIDERVAFVEARYKRDLAAKVVSDDVILAIHSIVEASKAALDRTASDVWKLYGKPSPRSPYFPIDPDPKVFGIKLDHYLPGLRTSKPLIAAAIERHQPFQPGKAVLGYLPELAKVENHQDFTPQTRNETARVTIQGRGTTVRFNPANIRISGHATVRIEGVPIDPATLRPFPGSHLTVSETVYVDWRFVDPPVSVLPTLQSLATSVREAVEDIRGAAGL